MFLYRFKITFAYLSGKKEKTAFPAADKIKKVPPLADKRPVIVKIVNTALSMPSPARAPSNGEKLPEITSNILHSVWNFYSDKKE